VTNRVPQFPGKGEGKPIPGYEKTMCPYLTAGEVARYQESLIETPGVQRRAPTAQGCKGPACALFISAKQPDGSALEGCAHVHQVLLLNSLNQQFAMFLAAAQAGAAVETAANAPAPSEPTSP
jgi:hypothetical protein